MERVTVIRARGKAILVPLIKVLKHFKISFGIIHDSDAPFRRNGDNNGMWTENGKIWTAIKQARETGVTIRHRVSIPDFERFLGGDEESKDKPLNAYQKVTNEAALSGQVQILLDELLSSEQHEPFQADAPINDTNYLGKLRTEVIKWASENSLAENLRFKGSK